MFNKPRRIKQIFTKEITYALDILQQCQVRTSVPTMERTLVHASDALHTYCWVLKNAGYIKAKGGRFGGYLITKKTKEANLAELLADCARTFSPAFDKGGEFASEKACLLFHRFARSVKVIDLLQGDQNENFIS